MKLFCFLLAVLILSVPLVSFADGPIGKGSILVNGGITFNKFNSAFFESHWTLSASPQLGYFVTKGALIGISFRFHHFASKFTDETYWSIGPVVGYYLGKIQQSGNYRGKFHPYVKGAVLFGKLPISTVYILSKSTGEEIGNKVITWGVDAVSLGGEVGIVFMLGNNIGFDIFGRFMHHDLKFEESVDYNSVTDITAGIGISGFIW